MSEQSDDLVSSSLTTREIRDQARKFVGFDIQETILDKIASIYRSSINAERDSSDETLLLEAIIKGYAEAGVSYDLVKIVCDWCGNSWIATWEDEETVRYCEENSCVIARKDTLSSYRDIYDPYIPGLGSLDLRIPWFNRKYRYQKHLNRVLGIPKKRLRWIRTAVHNPFTCIDRIRLLDERYRKGRDVSVPWVPTTKEYAEANFKSPSEV